MSWYYVQGSDRVGPIDEAELATLVGQKILNADSYIWRKGFDNWKKFREVEELSSLLEPARPVAPMMPPQKTTPQMPSPIVRVEIDWNTISSKERLFTIKTGLDRDGDETEYGPFTLDEMKMMFDEQRVNAKTLVFAPGMKTWSFLADLPIYESLFHSVPPVIDEVDRRKNLRKPFVARLLFHDQTVVYEGICRDVSVGGLQVLVSNFPAKVGDSIQLNVHPDNTDYCFVASGKVVRVLDGNQGFSLRFSELNAEAQNAIHQYIANV